MRMAWRLQQLALIPLAGMLLLSTGCVGEIVRKVPTGPKDANEKEDGSELDVTSEVEELVEDRRGDSVPEDGHEVAGIDVPLPQDADDVDLTVGPTVEVGPDGGTFSLEGGVTLVIPPGALGEKATLSLTQVAPQAPAGVTPVTETWKATPDGQKFKLPITVRLPLEDPGLEGEEWALMEGFVGGGKEFESVPAWPDLAANEVWVQTTHFSHLLAGLPAPPSTCLAHELCDGKDNDCDGAVDEASDLLKSDDTVTGCATQGVCALQVDVQCTDAEWSCEFKDPENPPPFWEPDVELSCDAQDNDCDGLVDEDLVGKVEVLEELGVEDIECRLAGLCSSANVVAACWKKSKNIADWVCDYSGVPGFEGEDELSCDSTDNDCDGEIDEGICARFDPCADDAACATGHCVVPMGGAENSFCTEAPEGCLAVLPDASLEEVPAGGTWCVEAMAHHLATCVNGFWEEPYLDCEDLEPVNPVCDPFINQCTGGCDIDLDCELYEEPCSGSYFCNDNSECEEDPMTAPLCHTQNWLCQEFFCDPDTGDCVAVSVGAGVTCDDLDACTGNGKCDAGVCTGAPTKGCDDEIPCTIDFCNPETGGCIFDPTDLIGAPCDDESVCTTNDVCQEDGTCDGQMKPCDDGNICTEDDCIPSNGQCQFVLTPGVSCSIGDPCLLEGTCSVGGQCVQVPVDCNDDNDCTADECVLGECEHSPVNKSTICLHPSSAPGGQDVCIPLGLCDGDSVCEPGEDLCDCHVDEDCLTSDDDLCNGTGTCEIGDGGLLFCVDQPGTVVVCDESEDTQCLVNTCAIDTGLCSMQPVQVGTPCSDGDECTGEDQCDAGACIGTVTVDCDDGNACTDNLCDSDDGCLTSPVAQGTTCQDGDPCTLVDKCDANGTCIAGTPKVPACDDEDVCTSDTCTANGSGCLFEPIAGCCSSNSECNQEGGEICTGEHVCCAPICVDEQGQELLCGDDGCGSTCGECGINAVCNDGACCFPNCYSPVKACGDDGCGGGCGSCEPGQVCTDIFQCCTPQCQGKFCGPDGCDGECGSCFAGFICAEETGLCEFCAPECDGKECGDDGCNDVCGQCPEGANCLDEGTCCTPECDGKTCGDDGCGGSCGGCLDWQACDAGSCVCEACCDVHKNCGPTELCGAQVTDGEDIFTICYEPMTAFFDGFEAYGKDTVPDGYTYYSDDGVKSWKVKVGVAPFTTNSGERSFRYYKQPVDPGSYFSFTRQLPAVGQEGFSFLSFASRCNSNVASFSFTVKAGQTDLLALSDSICDQKWHRFTVDLSSLSGATEFRFVVEKAEGVGAELFVDDLAIFVSDCPGEVACAEFVEQDNACTIDSITADYCFVNWVCYEHGESNPAIVCAACDSISSQSQWSPNHNLCDDDDPLTDDFCDVKEGCFNF